MAKNSLSKDMTSNFSVKCETICFLIRITLFVCRLDMAKINMRVPPLDSPFHVSGDVVAYHINKGKKKKREEKYKKRGYPKIY